MVWVTMFLPLYLAVLQGILANSCVERCGIYNWERSCQCNKACVQYNNCCDDFNQVCQPARCGPLSEVSGQMWNHDVNRVPDTAFDLNYQGQVPYRSSIDNASQKLFTRLDESVLERPNFMAFISLLDNYDPEKGVAETSTPQEDLEIEIFLDDILQTRVMDILFNYLKCLEIVRNLNGLRDLLYKLWFEGYPRSSKAVNPDTSGFEHVMVGEFKSQTKVNGFHGWLSFYLKEKVGAVDYRGYVRRQDPHIVGASFTWEGRAKSLTSIMVGPSPEFEMALFTLCFLTHERRPCEIVLGGHNVTIRTFGVDGRVATAFIAV